jgi:tRNA threonylcarbamoyladenosine biosynthesis protein TsaE
MNLALRSHSPERTFEIGKALGEVLTGDEIIFLCGELGVGKTLLTKGIGAALAIDPAEIVSPTFTVMNLLAGRLKGKAIRLFHFDLYRWAGAVGSHVPEIDEYIGEGIIVVEWAQYLDPAYLHLKGAVQVSLTAPDRDENARLIEIRTDLTYLHTPLTQKLTP